MPRAEVADTSIIRGFAVGLRASRKGERYKLQRTCIDVMLMRSRNPETRYGSSNTIYIGLNPKLHRQYWRQRRYCINNLKLPQVVRGRTKLSYSDQMLRCSLYMAIPVRRYRSKQAGRGCQDEKTLSPCKYQRHPDRTARLSVKSP